MSRTKSISRTGHFRLDSAAEDRFKLLDRQFSLIYINLIISYRQQWFISYNNVYLILIFNVEALIIISSTSGSVWAVAPYLHYEKMWLAINTIPTSIYFNLISLEPNGSRKILKQIDVSIVIVTGKKVSRNWTNCSQVIAHRRHIQKSHIKQLNTQCTPAVCCLCAVAFNSFNYAFQHAMCCRQR